MLAVFLPSVQLWSLTAWPWTSCSASLPVQIVPLILALVSRSVAVVSAITDCELQAQLCMSPREYNWNKDAVCFDNG